MNLIDIIILIGAIGIVIFLIYYNFFKHKVSACSGCAHHDECYLGSVESLKNYYKTQCDNRVEADKKNCC